MKGLIDPDHGQRSGLPCALSKGEQHPLQMSRAVTHLQDALSLYERNDAYDPVFPAISRNRRGDQIICEGKLMI